MHAIIGGGIAGCYIGLQLLERKSAFVILERASKNSAGKQQTLQRKGINIELGSSEQHTNQREWMHLLKMLGMEDKIRPFENRDPFFIWKSQSPAELQSFFTASHKFLSQAARGMKPGEITVEELANRFLLEAKKFAGIHPFWFEIKDQDAHTYFSCLSQEGEYFYLKGGQSQILQAAMDKLRNHIKFNTPVEYVSKEKGGWLIGTPDEKIFAEKIYISSNLSASKKILWLGAPEISRYLNTARSMRCLRWFLIFKKPLKLPQTDFSGDFPGKWSFRLNDFVWLISYVDGDLVDQVKKGNLASEWINFVRRFFGSDITYEDIEEQIVADWNDAYNILLPSYFKNRPKLPKNCVITSVAKPCGQAWIEGALIRL